MKIDARLIGAVCAVALALAAGAAAAQDSERGSESGSGMGMGPGMMMGRGGMGMMGGCPMMGSMMRGGIGGMGGKMAAHAEGRIAFLKAEIGITEAQQSVWDGYAGAVRNNLANMQSMHETMMKAMSAKSAVERLDQHIAGMEGRIAALKEIKTPLGALYDALSGDQKKKADDLLTGMGCMM